MNWTFLKQQLLLSHRSKKNVPFIIFIGIALLTYCFLFLPNEKTKETFDVGEVKSNLSTLDAEQQYRLANGHTGIVIRFGTPVFSMNAYSQGLFSAMLSAYEDGNATRWLHYRRIILRATVIIHSRPKYVQRITYSREGPSTSLQSNVAPV
ncbi:hypothetical protein QNH10_01685 [Sporosarcina thermotolerans]|uniref:hypothetical protein n=1 Tax=Sporosarcina thermotolerans TaxID=633404 RepID=UPI0024BC24E4|nr:hypothetical protein [Sporosarcina thermotolerans]WHT48573.1 hypothetical protein QNH10_01685 [Sporosarcina thermotolerans]